MSSNNRNNCMASTTQANDNSPERDDNDDLLTIHARESAPLEIGSLIRSKEDALSLHSVLRGHVIEMRGVGQDECKALGTLIEDLWDSPDFSESDATAIKLLTTKLHDLYDESDHSYVSWDDAAEFGAVEAILNSLSFAATWRATSNVVATETIAD